MVPYSVEMSSIYHMTVFEIAYNICVNPLNLRTNLRLETKFSTSTNLLCGLQ